MAMDVRQHAPSLTNFGKRGGPIDLTGGDVALGVTVKAITVVAEGNIVMRARDGSADITITGAGVGYSPPWVPGIVRQTGTTATLASIED